LATAQLRRQPDEAILCQNKSIEGRQTADFGANVGNAIGVQQQALELCERANCALQ
jgi:hypothetical protein